MSLLSIFDIGRTALLANRTAMSVTSHNIANVNNPDYSRQEVVFGIETPSKIRGSFLGRGVTVETIKRSYDRFLTDMLINQENTLGKSTVLQNILSQIEEVFNESNKNGLTDAINKFFNALEDLSTNPSDINKRIVLLNVGDQLISHFKTVENSIEDIKNNIRFEINTLVNKVNSLGKDLSDINKKIVQLEAGGNAQANDLRDKRDAILKELSSIININYYENNDKALVVMIGMRNLVNGGIFNELSAIPTEENVRLILDNIDISNKVTGGKINGLIESINLIENEVLYRIRKLTAGFTNEFNIIHYNGYNLNNEQGGNFFIPLSDIYYEEHSQNSIVTSISVNNFSDLKFDEYYITFKSGNVFEVVNKYNNQVITTGSYVSGSPIIFDGISVTITGTIADGDRFLISPIKNFIKKVGINIANPKEIALASIPNAPSDNSNLLNLINLKEKKAASLGNKNIYDYLNETISRVGSLSATSDDNLKFEQALYDETLNKKSIAQGVNLDEEAVNLIKYQRAFEAAAKVIQVANELYDTLVKLVWE